MPEATKIHVEFRLRNPIDAMITDMQAESVQRLVFLLSLGIYQDISGKFGKCNEAVLVWTRH